MTRLGDCFVRCCTRLNRVPAAVLCVVIYVLQAATIDYYLVAYMGTSHLAWMAADAVVLVLLVMSIVFSAFRLEKQKQLDNLETTSIAWVTWLLMHAILACKVVTSFQNFTIELDEDSFFGPNTFKTAIALGSCVFLLLLTTQHDAPPASERRQYIEDLTGTVFLDLLDTTDILEILFDKEETEQLASGVKEVVLAVAVLNLLLPTVPLVTLSKTSFGHDKLQKRLVYLHRLLIILSVNVPNLLVRIVLWHGFSVGISPFSLKNLILIVMTMYEFYEHKVEKYEEHQRERMEMEKEGVEMKDHHQPHHNHNHHQLPPRPNGMANPLDGIDADNHVDVRKNRGDYRNGGTGGDVPDDHGDFRDNPGYNKDVEYEGRRRITSAASDVSTSTRRSQLTTV